MTTISSGNRARRRRRAKPVARAPFILTLFALVYAAFWLGLVPQRLSPFAPLDLNQPDSWFLNFRLAALKSDSNLCRAVLKAPIIEANGIGDEPIEKGCGWRNAVRISEAGGARTSIDRMTCEMGAAFAMWMAHEVQPAAEDLLGSGVRSVKHMGTYACRNIAGSPRLAGFRSQHARANAIDIQGFTLADGRTLSVAHDWKAKGKEAEFLRRIHYGACRYFRVALGPDYNAAHANHFHFDRGAYKTCR